MQSLGLRVDYVLYLPASFDPHFNGTEKMNTQSPQHTSDEHEHHCPHCLNKLCLLYNDREDLVIMCPTLDCHLGIVHSFNLS